MTPAASDLRLPDGAVLLHIGPHKTGTTSVQFALHEARPELERHGVIYAGRGRHAVDAAQAVRGLPPVPNHQRGVRQWRGIVRQVADAPRSRVVLSSEWYAEATPAAIERIVEELGGDRVHVVVTLRPLAALLPSQWQQYVQGGLVTSYDDWLTDNLGGTEILTTKSFWRRHRHDELVRRWASVVGPERVTVVIVDDRDHGFVLRAFESMLDLPAGTLPLVADRSNRSLTWPEIEVLRGINQALLDAGMPGADRSSLVLFGAAPSIRERQPGPDEPRIRTPEWAAERAVGIGAEMAAGIAGLGVRVVGDLASLSTAPAARAPGGDPVPAPWAEIAGATARGMARYAGLLAVPGAGEASASPGRHLGTGQLASLLALRLRRAIARRLRRFLPTRQVAARDS